MSSGPFAGGDTHVPQEKNVGKAVEAQMKRTSDHAAIPDLASPSGSYVSAEAIAARDKINEILDVLRDSGLIPDA